MAAMTNLQRVALHRAGPLLTGLEPGEQVPSERKTAEASSLGRSVVRGLFQSLAAEKYIVRHGGRWILRRRLPKPRAGAAEEIPLTKRQVVKNHLIEGLSGGGWREGRRISELALSRELGVSTVTVREALLELQPLGLITKRDRHQWEVVTFRERRIADLREFREMVEGFALRKLFRAPRLAARQPGFAENREKTRHVLTSGGSPRAMLAVDLEFHRLLLDAADNPILKERADFIYLIIEFQLMNPRFRVERGQLGLRQHLKVLDAILQGDLPAAERQLRLHLKAAEETFRQVAGGRL
jgi:DNA-binding GntR family transcriptional regulator